MVKVFADISKLTKSADEQTIKVIVSGEDAVDCFELDMIAPRLHDQLESEFGVTSEGGGDYVDEGFDLNVVGTVTFYINLNSNIASKKIVSNTKIKQSTVKKTLSRMKKVKSSIDLKGVIEDIMNDDDGKCFLKLIKDQLQQMGHNVEIGTNSIKNYECDGKINFSYEY